MKVPEYHVSAGSFAIYAGIVNKIRKDGLQTWKTKSDVTDEALCAVRDYLSDRIEKGKDSFGYEWDTKDGKTVELVVKIKDKENEK